MLVREGDARQTEETLPADALDPLADPLMLPGILCVDLDDVLHSGNGFRPQRRIIRQVGDRQLGKHRFAPGIGDLPAHPDGNPVVVGIGNGHGRADGVAVPAVHALVVVDADGLGLAVPADGARRA